MIKIKNIQAATLFGYNAGIRSHYEQTDAVLNDSLFLDYLMKIGINVWKGKSTRDIIGLVFDFGTRSYKEEMKYLSRLKDNEQLVEKVKANKDKFVKLSKDELREKYYTEGVSVKYKEETIHYKMLYRTPSKAKVGVCMFIRDELYDKAHEWMTMGIADKLPDSRAKIVELSAYAPLSTSTIVDKFHLPVDNILVLEDQQSTFRTMAKIVGAIDDGNDGIKCTVTDKETDVVNEMWDGMALIESEILPDFCNGMALLRNHFFKTCAFKTRIQQFFMDWYGEDYNPDKEIIDMFGRPHKLKDIKVITTNNSLKWLKFIDQMGGSKEKAYDYWVERLKADCEVWGIVKTDHPSKLNDVQQMSYQMVNTLPCTTNDIFELADTSVRFVEKLKNDEDFFEQYLRKSATVMNHHEMMADLYRHNHEFAKSAWYRTEKTKVINNYVRFLKTGKITVEADNLTVCGNPYALLMYTVGGAWEKDPTLRKEDGCIQCYTTRFDDGEYLCGIRNPHNSTNNIVYFHNKRSSIMERYFDFSENILAVNCIKTDIQSRANGMDFDSDFMYVTNNGVMVRSAEVAYRDYPTIVNNVPESGVTYNNTLSDYAKMDNTFARSQMSIGESSNVAQLALTYYWTEPSKELYDIFVILSVVAQIAIDSIKRIYAVDPVVEIRRIRNLDCMKKYNGCDFPEFMRYTRQVEYTKKGKPRDYGDILVDKNKLASRINPDLQCPMNTLVGVLSGIPRMRKVHAIPTEDFFIKEKGRSDNRKITKTQEMIEKASYNIYLITTTPDLSWNYKAELIEEIQDEIIEYMRKVRTKSHRTINRMIGLALGVEKFNNESKKNRTMLNLLYRMDPDVFLKSFKSVL